MKIKVRPEGRDGVWLVDKKEMLDWLKEYPEDQIHNFVQGGPCLMGADWEKRGVIGKVYHSERIAILTGEAQAGNRRHALAVIEAGELYMFDIGTITEADLEIAVEEKK